MENKEFKEVWFDSTKDKVDDKLYYHGRQIVEAKDFLPVLKEIKRLKSQINFLLVTVIISFSLSVALLVVFILLLKTI